MLIIYISMTNPKSPHLWIEGRFYEKSCTPLITLSERVGFKICDWSNIYKSSSWESNFNE